MTYAFVLLVASIPGAAPSVASKEELPAKLLALLDDLGQDDDLKRDESRLAFSKEVRREDLPALFRLVVKRDARTRCEFMRSLHGLRGLESPELDAFLIDRLRQKCVEDRYGAASAACHFMRGSKGLAVELIKLLDDDSAPSVAPRTSVAVSAIYALTFAGGAARPGHAKLIQIAKGHRNKTTRHFAFMALGLLRSTDLAHRPLLVQALIDIARDDREDEYRATALGCLTRNMERDSTLVPYFRRYWARERAKDGGGSILVRESILNNYMHLGPSALDALPDVLAVIRDKNADRRLRFTSFAVLYNYGEAGAEAIPTLEEVAVDTTDTFEFRRSAENALRRLKK